MLDLAVFAISPALTPTLCRGVKALIWVKFAISAVLTPDLDRGVKAPLWVTRQTLAARA